MRILFAMPLLFLGGCWTPGPGEIDPTRYPWNQPRMATAPIVPVQEQYCVVALEPSSRSGITFGGKSKVQLGCGMLPNAKPEQPPKR